ncbi:18541_t:CDS:2 [Dentiscutata erythropus]|uniref:18541_t:CDS:1 n=1 Tax=Dentiscutata erythropus TaxID=1348616 RepID=A0A9N9ADG9_9GLOM|nr:18541_t:CDS:2 [Dentiscutata erythropus]
MYYISSFSVKPSDLPDIYIGFWWFISFGSKVSVGRKTSHADLKASHGDLEVKHATLEAKHVDLETH